jgi:hypothetical protein
MFERYTEGARRTVFFARYEVSSLGSPSIDTEHLLLGILREDKELIRHVLLKVDYDLARQGVTKNAKLDPKKTVSTNVDLPLSEHAKRALKYSAEEADRLNHRHIGTTHLLLGLVRDREFTSAEVLSELGVKLESLRKNVETLGHRASPREYYVAPLRRPPDPPNTIEIHAVRRNLEHIQMSVSRCRAYAWLWEQKPWKASDIMMKKDGKGFSFDLRLVENSSEFMLVKGGWKKDHCAICRWELFESDEASHGVGFTNGRDWVCTECHQKFIAGGFFSSAYSDIT